jgi:hypothetical protein
MEQMSRFESELSRLPGQTTGTSGGGHGGTYPLKGVCPPASVPFVPGQMSRCNVPVGDKAAGRAAMPVVAGIVDDLRQAFGRAVVDAAIASGQALRRKHAGMVAAVGQDQADAWLARQRPPAGSFWAQEGKHSVGIRLGVFPC